MASNTFEQLSALIYGTEAHAEVLRGANPGKTGYGGLIFPTIAGAPKDQAQQIPATSPDEVALLIDGVRYRYWSEMSITRTIDSIDTLDIKAPFSADVPQFKETFQPFTYKDMTVNVGGDPLFTGVMVSVDPSITDTEKTVTVSAYAKCGVLADVNPSASSLPTEYNNQNLQAIATALGAPFGIAVELTAATGPAFERVALDPTRRILEFLTELAQQRGLIISSNSAGDLVFGKPTDAPPVARLKQGESPVTGITPNFDPQNYFSHITGLESAQAGKPGGQFTVKNPHVKNGVRPFNFTVTDADGPDVETATKAKAGRMIGNMASYTVTVCTWRDSAGALWAPGSTVTLTAPDALVYTEYKFIIRTVTLSQDSDSRTAALELAMLGAFNGEIPESLPWA